MEVNCRYFRFSGLTMDIIEQKKFCRTDYVHYISDSLARVCNSLKSQTVTALHLDFKDNQQIVIKFATKYKIRDTIIEEFKGNLKKMIKSFYDESKTYIFLDNFTRIKKFQMIFRMKF
jgi:hypothetical protein